MKAPHGRSIFWWLFPIKFSISDYRSHLAKNLAAERDGDVVDIVGMHAPQSEPGVDSRCGRDIHPV